MILGFGQLRFVHLQPVQYLGELGVGLQVRRNDEVTIEQIRALKPERILVSPGPCSPREAGLSNDVIRTFAGRGDPRFFGVCLGHQCIGHHVRRGGGGELPDDAWQDIAHQT